MLIRAIKVYFAEKKQKKKLKKYINHEILETLAGICLYLRAEGQRTHNPWTHLMDSHAATLSDLSRILRKELVAENTNETRREK